MPRKDYAEYILIQQTTAELLEQELKRNSVFAYDTDDFGGHYRVRIATLQS